ncbi:PTS transporter subunit EIIB [Facklamia lactis]|uniref:PTS transporter subunit EIIB n=1 Tax=Facklamia lactis TaxID=2749967 RepID=UPI0034DD9245
MMVGISEPFEYTFLFVAPFLYWLVYAPLVGITYVLAEVFKISINGTAILFMVPNLFQPHKVHAWHALWLIPLCFVVFYFVFKFIILKWDLPTPGRKEQEVRFHTKQEYRNKYDKNNALNITTDIAPIDEYSLEERIVNGLGGAENIDSITNCASRLRISVKNEKLVADEGMFINELEALGVVKSGKSIQLIYGVKVQNIATRVKDVLDLD